MGAEQSVPKGFTNSGMSSQSGGRFHRWGLNSQTEKQVSQDGGSNSQSAQRFHTTGTAVRAVRGFTK